MLTLWQRFSALFRRARLDGELHDEIEAHLAMQEEEFRQQGMSPAAARAAARREFGGVAQAQEAYRERRGIPWLEIAAKDVRYAVRGLRRNPGFTAAAVLSLALGIGANTAIFTLFHALMLRMLPVERPGELVILHVGKDRGFASDALYHQLAQRTDLFSGVLGRGVGGKERFFRSHADRAEVAAQESVSPNYFDVLGVRPALGRFFTDDDARPPQGQRFAVMGYDLWHNRFGADPRVLGSTLRTERAMVTIIGVAPPGFHGVGVESRTELWFPIRVGNDTHISRLLLMARRRSDVPRPTLEAALDVLMQQYGVAVWGSLPASQWKREAMDQRIEIQDGGIGVSFLRDEFGKPLQVLMAAVGVVLLATCANLAHLLLARGAARRREIAVRYALGATRGRLIRQGLTESFLIAAMGCALGLLGALWGGPYLLLFVPAGRVGDLDVAPNAAVLAFTIAISLAAALVFGLAPALRSSAVDPVAGLRSDSAAGTGRPILRRSLVAAQVAFSVILVALAGLFSHSLAQLRSVDLGFRNDSVITFWLYFPNRWKDSEQSAARQRFLVQAASMAGVTSVSYSSPDILQGNSWGQAVRVAGSTRTAREPGKVHAAALGPHFLETIGAAPLLGRDFNPSDTAASTRVAIVNETFVHAFLDGESNPIAQVLNLNGEEQQPRQIVGVIRDIVHRDLKHPAEPMVYVPDTQIESPMGPSFVVRGVLPPVAMAQNIRQSLLKIDPEFTPGEPHTVRQRLDESIFEERMLATLSGFFGVLALLLAAVGLYGVVAYGAAQRAREIGVRIALGAERADVLRLVLRDALLLVAAGLAIGLTVSLVAARAVASILFGIHPADPVSFVSTAGVLFAVGAAAAFLPARRAASMDPMRALRQE